MEQLERIERKNIDGRLSRGFVVGADEFDDGVIGLFFEERPCKKALKYLPNLVDNITFEYLRILIREESLTANLTQKTFDALTRAISCSTIDEISIHFCTRVVGIEYFKKLCEFISRGSQGSWVRSLRIEFTPGYILQSEIVDALFDALASTTISYFTIWCNSITGEHFRSFGTGIRRAIHLEEVYIITQNIFPKKFVDDFIREIGVNNDLRDVSFSLTNDDVADIERANQYENGLSVYLTRCRSHEAIALTYLIYLYEIDVVNVSFDLLRLLRSYLL
jgi:hypothetical protein